jgi:TetR/AcrR family transcriptional regulator of autoinduction and epiphytic fitness
MKQRLTDRKHRAIMEAAMSEFCQTGYDATSMDRIAATAGVSKRTVYNHFPSKEELFFEILQDLWTRAAASTQLAYSTDRPIDEQLLELACGKLALMADPAFIDLARMGIAEVIRNPERARAIVCRLDERQSGLHSWIRAASADGKLAIADADFAATQLEGLIKTFAFWPQITLGAAMLTEEERRRIASSAVDMFLARYRV